jgi:D-glycero-alpha-D-manno-heptose-7-phosphate kinase
VGLLNGPYRFHGICKSPIELAEEASRIDIEIPGKPIGRQDQYAAAVGGFNLIEFLRRGRGVHVHPVICRMETLKRLQRSLMLFYTGCQRSAVDVLDGQRRAVRDGRSIDALKRMRDLALELRAGSISDESVDNWYEEARQAGATGGKILGAGGGGFLLLFVPPDRQDAVRATLSALRGLPLRFSAQGTHIAVLGWTGTWA